MSDVPERVWLEDVTCEYNTKAATVFLDHTERREFGTEYIRADIHHAEVARLREALELMADAGRPHSKNRRGEECGCECCDAYHNAVYLLEETDEQA